jgi:hypothetical protein
MSGAIGLDARPSIKIPAYSFSEYSLNFANQTNTRSYRLVRRHQLITIRLSISKFDPTFNNSDRSKDGQVSPSIQEQSSSFKQHPILT